MEAFGAAWIPLFISTYLKVQTNGTEFGFLKVQLDTILAFNVISAISVTFLVFIEWKKGPKWYLKVSPLIFFSLTLLNFIIIPVANIALFLYFCFINKSFSVKQIFIESWVVFFVVVSFSHIFEFFFVIRKSVITDAKNYMAARK